MNTIANLEFYQHDLKFSAGHFTIFSQTRREHLHGHNYSLEVKVSALMQEPGLSFDYNLLKKKLVNECATLNSRFLLPSESPYLKIEDQGVYYHAIFNGEAIPFLKSDVIILPLSNITLEELSKWFVEKILEDKNFIEEEKIQSLMIKVFNGPDQSASFRWER